MTDFIKMHSGTPNELYTISEDKNQLMEQAQEYPSWDLSLRQLCDLELLLNGGFSPLDGFLNQADYNCVIENMRLSDGTLYPIPITLDVSEEFVSNIKQGDSIALCDPEGVLIAVLEVGDIWQPDKRREAQRLFGSTDEQHPDVFHLLHKTESMYIGGRLRGIEPPTHYDFPHLRDSPHELRERFIQLGWQRVAAFQTDSPMHRAHQEMTLCAIQQAEANLLIHAAMNPAQSSNNSYYSRVRCYQHLLKNYPKKTAILSLFNLSDRMAGLRSILWNAIIHQNYGCSHSIVNLNQTSFGNHNTIQEQIEHYQQELDIHILAISEPVYVQEQERYISPDEVQTDETMLAFSGAEFYSHLQEGREIPDWFSYPEIVNELRCNCPPRHQQGFTVFLTGLSGSGKSTIANALRVQLLELGSRAVTLLDGDLVRKHLSSELGFSREHRNLNILRIGFVASEITKNGGIAICAPIAPYTATRRQVREMITPHGGFIEIHVATPLEVCESRDRKGLYAKARAGLLKEFTGISDPYETPKQPELRLDTHDCTPIEAAQRIVLKLESLGYLKNQD